MNTPTATEQRPGPVARLLLLLVRAYRSTTAWRGPRCRFSPSCSSYASTAIAHHGAFAGSWLAIRRVARCHPWHPGGHDPVPVSPRSVRTP